MAYATQQDMEERYGQDALITIADRNDDGAVDSEVVERALADASAEIDPYLAKRTPLPLTEVPALLVRLCVDIAIYRLTAEADGNTEERRTRYDDAIALLKSIAAGKVSLGLATPPPSVGGGVVLSGPSRLFSRDTMGRL
ncbi:hypothetical protein DSLASN_02430 [Desulfoluna limicola]|uniref:Mu-like prophage protein gp36 n=1 Tax=Desulfoluna limicola TaxID=2810562 RepID=A0ABM7PBP0_9BACT|nr:DUF1320 domain-containing protein [Desulfoluna limicola]BCS94611.1 hypothetical protein DSLASN_02430 [Desulfoluna limicola]